MCSDISDTSSKNSCPFRTIDYFLSYLIETLFPSLWESSRHPGCKFFFIHINCFTEIDFVFIRIIFCSFLGHDGEALERATDDMKTLDTPSHELINFRVTHETQILVILPTTYLSSTVSGFLNNFIFVYVKIHYWIVEDWSLWVFA